jgi:hypothetical protein
MGVTDVAAFLHQQDLIAKANQGGAAPALADFALPTDGGLPRCGYGDAQLMAEPRCKAR